MRKLTLLPYQGLDLEEVMSHLLQTIPTQILVAYCTGAGKTCFTLALGGRLLATETNPGAPFTHIVIGAPTNVIRDGFNLSGYDAIEDLTSTSPIVPVKDDSYISLPEYLANPMPGYMLRLTHAAIRGSFDDSIRDSIRTNPHFGARKLWVSDEGHHGRNGNVLGDVWAQLLAAGSSIVHATATPPENLKDLFTVKRTLPEQMVDGRYAPELLLNELCPVEGTWVAEESGDERAAFVVPKNRQRVARAIVEHASADSFHSEGRLKALVRVKNESDGDANHATIKTIAAAIFQNGQRVFVASDVHVEKWRGRGDPDLRAMNELVLAQIREKLRQDPDAPTIPQTGDISEVRQYEHYVVTRGKGFQESCVDVVVGMDGIVEGFDWPFLSHVYIIGIPGELDTLIQVLGRVMRLRTRIRDYPRAWLNRSKIVMLVAKDATGKIERRQTAQMIAVCAYLAMLQQWSPIKALSRALKNVKLGEASEEEIEKIYRGIRPRIIDEKLQAKILAGLSEAERLWARAGVMNPSQGLGWRTKVKMTDVVLNKAHFESPGRTAEREVSVRDIQHVILGTYPDAHEKLAQNLEKGLKENPDADPPSLWEESVDKLIDEFDSGARVTSPQEEFLRSASVLSVDGPMMLAIGAAVQGFFDNSPQGRSDEKETMASLEEHLRRHR
jgi:hypothetical protein